MVIEVHVVSDLHWKQRPDETWQEYIHFTNLTEKAMGINPANITNCVIILFFIKNVYNKDIRQWVAGAKTISPLADAFRLAHHSLLNLKKYKGLTYHDSTCNSRNQPNYWHNDKYRSK